jgi:ABC-type uncharacterized transport system permease subunit
MLNFLKILATPEFFFSIIRISAPIIFATLAAIVVEKAGFANIGLEGLMMFSALSGSLVSFYAGSWFWGLLGALATGVLLSLVMGFFAFRLKTDIILVGIAMNMMGSGGTLFLCKVITNLTQGKAMASTTGLITKSLCIPNITLPLIKNTMLVCITLCVAGNMKAFDNIYTMTKGAPANKTDTMVTLLYMRAFYDNQKAAATAMSVIGFAILCVCAGVYMMVTMRKEER